MLEQQASHPASSHHRHLLLVQGHKFIDTAGLAKLELGKFHRCGADRHRSGAQVCFRANPFATAHRLIQQAIENGANGMVLLAQAHHLLYLGKDLAFTQHEGVQSRRDPQQVGDRLLVMEGEEVGNELVNGQARVLAQERTDRGDALLGVPEQGVDLQPVAGAED